MATVVDAPFQITEDNHPGVLSSDHRAMLSYWNLIDAILGGVETMRKAGELYLPRFQAERKNSVDENGQRYDPYQVRLDQTPFTAIYEDLALNIASKPFQKECRLQDGSPKDLEGLAENIDMQGNDLHVFSANWFWQAVNYAIGWVLVDHTPQPEALTPGGQPRSVTLADERAAGIRPYWVNIPATSVLAAYTAVIGGRETLVHFTFEETYTRIEGWKEYEVQRVRHYWRDVVASDNLGRPLQYGPPRYAVWEASLTTEGNTARTTWKIVETGLLVAAGGKPLSQLPIVWFVTGRRKAGSFYVRPALRSLAWMQIAEYQQEANLQNILNLTAFPMFAGQGIQKPDVTPVVGPRAVLYAPPNQTGEHGQWTIIEPTGSSIEQVRKQLEDTRNEMRELGKQPLTTANLTVITSSMVEAKASSVAQMWAIMFQDACERAWQVTAEWMGRNEQPEVFVFKDFSAGVENAEAFKDVLAMRTSKDLSRYHTLEAAVRFGRLPDDFDYDENDEQLAEESDQAANEMEIDPLTGRPVVRQPPAAVANGNGAQPEDEPTLQ